MKIEHPAQAEKMIEDALNGPQQPYVRACAYGDIRILIKLPNYDELSIVKHGSDGKVRLAGISTYGNHSFIHGRGCDASGYVVKDSHNLRRIENLIKGVTA